MKKAKHKNKGRGISFVREPVTLLLGARESVRAEGVKRVLLCTEEEIRLRLRLGGLRVQGKELVCTTYSCGAVEIVGRVEHLHIEGGENHENSPS
ncbi:MAG: YabP/YqfC family sporulation protein [Clostridia bacterium]|nr:YabP/YqfC family sporulation protein [Clostridia bacterium]